MPDEAAKANRLRLLGIWLTLLLAITGAWVDLRVKSGVQTAILERVEKRIDNHEGRLHSLEVRR